MPNKSGPSVDAGDERHEVEVTEITHLVDLSGWPAGGPMLAWQAEDPPGVQVTSVTR
jgi:hypothetical protein